MQPTQLRAHLTCTAGENVERFSKYFTPGARLYLMDLMFAPHDNVSLKSAVFGGACVLRNASHACVVCSTCDVVFYICTTRPPSAAGATQYKLSRDSKVVEMDAAAVSQTVFQMPKLKITSVDKVRWLC